MTMPGRDAWVSKFGIPVFAVTVDVKKLLQAERARLRRKVRKLQRFGFNTGIGTLEADSEGAWIYRGDLLAAWARGKR